MDADVAVLAGRVLAVVDVDKKGFAGAEEEDNSGVEVVSGAVVAVVVAAGFAVAPVKGAGAEEEEEVFAPPLIGVSHEGPLSASR